MSVYLEKTVRSELRKIYETIRWLLIALLVVGGFAVVGVVGSELERREWKRKLGQGGRKLAGKKWGRGFGVVEIGRKIGDFSTEFAIIFHYEPVPVVVAKMRSRRLLRDSGGVVRLVRSGAGKYPRPGGIPVRRFSCGYAGRHPSFGKHRPFGVARNSRNHSLAADCLAGRFGAFTIVGLVGSQSERQEWKQSFGGCFVCDNQAGR